ncbi:MAG: GlsB/YeaQ/YmgE family stress response membrane protein [Myxococcaceae bacterium]|nr:GlsB/YeaQ/YmgE family stress response membrane protein [Myxococcaceae bacterium]
MGILAWIILGGGAGWVASMVMGTNARMGAIANIVVGVIGSVIGGWVFSFFGGYGVTGFNLYSFGVALVGACVLLGVAKAVMR